VAISKNRQILLVLTVFIRYYGTKVEMFAFLTIEYRFCAGFLAFQPMYQQKWKSPRQNKSFQQSPDTVNKQYQYRQEHKLPVLSAILPYP